MKKILLMVAAAMLTAISAQAQRLKVVDVDGNPVSYASVLNPEAEHIGVTNLDGEVADLAGATDITVTHVAFKTKRLKVGGGNVTVTLEDADFSMPEISIQPKPYIYVQTYYRIYYYSSTDGIIYYRGGLTDNTYEVAKKKMKCSVSHTAKAKYGVLKTLFALVGGKLDDQSHISVRKLEERLADWAKPMKITFTDIGPGKQRISDSKGTIGYVTDDAADHQRRYAYNSSVATQHKLEEMGETEKLAKREKHNARRKNKENTDYFLYQIDDAGHYSPEDFIMSQYMSSWDEEENGKTEHTIIALQVFSTDRAYVTKDELKARKKQNKMKLTYANIRQFERDHNIPALAPAVQQKLNELWKSGE